jgi:hypothetical protein
MQRTKRKPTDRRLEPMTDSRLMNTLAAIEQAQAQLEIALRGDAHWLALRQATQPAHRAALERALADNPVFHAWRLLGGALAEVQAGRGLAQSAALPDTARDTALAQAPKQRPRVELRQVLEHIRGDSTFDRAEVPSRATAAPATTDENADRPKAAPTIAPADIEIEEAAVSFVVHKMAAPSPRPTPAADRSAAVKAGPGVADSQPAPIAVVAPDRHEDNDGSETEVTIVPRRR